MARTKGLIIPLRMYSIKTIEWIGAIRCIKFQLKHTVLRFDHVVTNEGPPSLVGAYLQLSLTEPERE